MSESKEDQNQQFQLKNEYRQKLKPRSKVSPWILRVTVHKGKPVPVLLVKERFFPNGGPEGHDSNARKSVLRDRGLIYGQPLRRCLPVIRNIVGRICDHAGIPLDLQRFFPSKRISFRGNLPLDEEAGAKLSLIFKLQERITDMNRIELIAWRIDRFSREEAVYWLTRATQYGPEASRWAQAGMRIMLGGQPGDQGIIETLERLRR